MAIIIDGGNVGGGASAGMTFLQLCQRARRKCRMGGNGPQAITDNTEEYSRLIDWVNESWLSLQREHEKDWYFMRGTCSAQTQDGLYAYGATEFGLTDLGQFLVNYQTGDSFRCYDSAVGLNSEVLMGVTDYDKWRDQYLLGALRNTRARPTEVAIGPDGQLYVGPVPGAGWTITGEYLRVPTEMAAATDIPSLPAQYHMAIVYKTMMLYGVSEAAQEVYMEGKNQYDLIMRQVESTQLPRMGEGGALA